MTKHDLIHLIGDVIVELDGFRFDVPRGTKDRVCLDDVRDNLDTAQRQLVRHEFDDNTPGLQRLCKRLEGVNGKLNQTIGDVGKIAKTLETLDKFVGVVQEIINLLP
jgi:hypothetical protein